MGVRTKDTPIAYYRTSIGRRRVAVLELCQACQESRHGGPAPDVKTQLAEGRCGCACHVLAHGDR